MDDDLKQAAEEEIKAQEEAEEELESDDEDL